MINIRLTYYVLIALLGYLIGASPLYGQNKDNPAKYGKDSIACVKKLNSLTELCQAKKFDEALPYWRWISANCPAASENSYVEAAAIYDKLIPIEKDSLKREALIDTLLMIFDQRILYFKNTGYVLGRKGYKQYEYRPYKPFDAYESLRLSVGGEVFNSRPSILAVYFEVTMVVFRSKKIDTLTVYKVYDEILKIADYHLLRKTKDAALYNEVKNEVQNGYNAMSHCDDLDSLYGPLFTADTSNMDQIIRFIKSYEEHHCFASRLYFYLIKQIYELDKCSKTAIMAADYYRVAQHHNQARGYYESVIRSQDTLYAYQALIRLGDMIAQVYKDYGYSRLQLTQAIELCPKKPEAYIALGDLFVKSSRECNQTALDSVSIYWLATDQYLKAKYLDSAISQIVDDKIKMCEEHYPDKAMLERNNLHESDTFQVKCWINQATTVKVRP